LFKNIVDGILMVLNIYTVSAVFFGIIIGQIMGAIPGLTGTMAIIIILPLTFHMSPWVAIPMLLAVVKGSNFAGSIPAILIATPGVSSSAATVFDGHELAKQGKAGKALSLSLYSGVLGDLTSDIVLFIAAGIIAKIALKFGPAEFSSIIIFSLTMVGLVSSDNLIKGFIAAVFGILISTIGLDPIFGTNRLTFGVIELMDGIGLMPMFIGIIALSEMIIQAEKINKSIHFSHFKKSSNPQDNRLSFAEFRSCLPTIFRSAGLGTAIGALPGLGATVAAFLAYSEAKRISKRPELFGKGSLEGVAAPESANNAVNGANIIPLLSLGIPGDMVAAVLLAAFMLQGLNPGPLLFKENTVLIYALYSGLIIAHIANLLVGIFFIKLSLLILRIPKGVIFPLVIALCFIGTYTINNSMFDLFVMVFFGVFGYIIRKLDFPPICLIIGFILGPLLETSIRQALIRSSGNFLVFINRPISLAFLILTVVMVISISRKKASDIDKK